VNRLDALVQVSYADLVEKARALAATRSRAHLHTAVPGCAITGGTRPAIVLEATDEGTAYAFFDDAPIDERAKPLAILLHGADTVPAADDPLEPACERVTRMADRMRAGAGHFHILSPLCLANPYPGRWTIVFEDRELGVLESVSDERPLADIRLVERLIYAPGTEAPVSPRARRRPPSGRAR
jgi:hypothetical protein